MSEKETIETAVNPGDQLRKARERLGLSLKDISERTLISVARLEALEKQDFERVGGAAYVTGYTRAYARLVKLDSVALVSSFETLLGVEKQSVQPAEFSIQPPRKRLVSPGIAAFLLLALILAALVVFYVYGRSSKEEMVTSAGSSSLSIASSSVSSIPLAELYARQSPDSAVESLKVEEPASTLESVQAMEVMEESSENMEESSENKNQESDELTLGRGSAAQPLVAPANSNEPQDVSVQPTPRVPQSTMAEPSNAQALDTAINDEVNSIVPEVKDTLVLSFHGECWLEVKDASGEVKIAQMVHSGDNLQLFGVAPFELMLGNASVADVLFNGDMITVPRRPGRKTARFTIGQKRSSQVD